MIYQTPNCGFMSGFFLLIELCLEIDTQKTSGRGAATARANNSDLSVIFKLFYSLVTLAQENDYDLVFPSKSTANYAVYNSMPSLTMLTASVWIRLTHESVHYIFTYASSTSNEAIAFGYHATTAKLYFNINAPDWRYVSSFSVLIKFKKHFF